MTSTTATMLARARPLSQEDCWIDDDEEEEPTTEGRHAPAARLEAQPASPAVLAFQFDD